MKKVVHSAEEMKRLAEAWVLTLPCERKTACVVGLSGDLGAGKTTFVQGVAEALGVVGQVTSPTFVIQKAYPTTGCFRRLIHIDAYRLNSAHELEILRFAETTSNPESLVLVEWPERISPLLDKVPTLRFAWVHEGERSVEWDD